MDKSNQNDKSKTIQRLILNIKSRKRKRKFTKPKP